MPTPPDPAPAPGYSWPHLYDAPPFVVCDRCAAIVALDLDPTAGGRGAGPDHHDRWHRRAEGIRSD